MFSMFNSKFPFCPDFEIDDECAAPAALIGNLISYSDLAVGPNYWQPFELHLCNHSAASKRRQQIAPAARPGYGSLLDERRRCVTESNIDEMYFLRLIHHKLILKTCPNFTISEAGSNRCPNVCFGVLRRWWFRLYIQ
jgi:hypothetical protein